MTQKAIMHPDRLTSTELELWLADVKAQGLTDKWLADRRAATRRALTAALKISRMGIAN